MARSGKLALFSLALGLLGAERALAELGERLVYHAPNSCPAREEFEARVQERTGAPSLDEGAPFERFEVELHPTRRGARGRLVTRQRGAAPTVREIKAGSCSEAADALALIVALTLDPNAAARAPQTRPERDGDNTKPRATPEAQGSDTSSATRNPREKPRSAPGARQRPTQPASNAPQPPPLSSAPRPEPNSISASISEPRAARSSDAHLRGARPRHADPRDASPPSARPNNARRTTFDLLVSASAASGVAPRWAPEGGASLGLTAPFIEGYQAMLRVGVRRAPEQTTATSQGDATFSLWAAHAALCPLVAELERLWLVPCVSFEYGKLSARGARTSNATSSERDFLTLGPKLAGQLRLATPLYLHLGAELGIPLRRDRYVLGSLEVYATPSALGRFELGLGVRL